MRVSARRCCQRKAFAVWLRWRGVAEGKRVGRLLPAVYAAAKRRFPCLAGSPALALLLPAAARQSPLEFREETLSR